jgi:hypothetical protein
VDFAEVKLAETVFPSRDNPSLPRRALPVVSKSIVPENTHLQNHVSDYLF